jgi:hypothetical protein
MDTLSRCQDGIDEILREIAYVIEKCTGHNVNAMLPIKVFNAWSSIRLQWIRDLTKFNLEQDLKYRNQIHHLLTCLESYFGLLSDTFISMALQNITDLLSYAKIIKGIVDITSIESVDSYINQIQKITNSTNRTVAFEALLVATQTFQGNPIEATRKTIKTLLKSSDEESHVTHRSPWHAMLSLVNILESTARR